MTELEMLIQKLEADDALRARIAELRKEISETIKQAKPEKSSDGTPKASDGESGGAAVEETSLPPAAQPEKKPLTFEQIQQVVKNYHAMDDNQRREHDRLERQRLEMQERERQAALDAEGPTAFEKFKAERAKNPKAFGLRFIGGRWV